MISVKNLSLMLHKRIFSIFGMHDIEQITDNVLDMHFALTAVMLIHGLLIINTVPTFVVSWELSYSNIMDFFFFYSPQNRLESNTGVLY